MAYVSKETKKELAPAIKKVLAEYGVKGTIRINNHSMLVVTLRKVPAGQRLMMASTSTTLNGTLKGLRRSS